ncbi:MAG: hypothetical protein H7329_11310 [Opitutaceae bacterium]|nr:hypothetical protein [Cytophagales bacterium]
MDKATNLTLADDLCMQSQKITKFGMFNTMNQANMSKIFILCLVICCISLSTFAGTGLKYGNLDIRNTNDGNHASRFNLKLQPAFYWSSLGLEAELVLSAKVSVALNIIGKVSGLDGKHAIKNKISDDFFKTGYLTELIGRYYIVLNKKKLTLAPSGFYIQAAAGFSKLLYFDGSTRPFSLNTRFPNNYDSNGNADYSELVPIIGGIGTGYQVELLPGKIIANMLVGGQTNIDSKGVFFTFYASPSVGIMF